MPASRGSTCTLQYASVRFFTDNNAYLGTGRLSQHPLGVFTAHYSHNIGQKTWFGIGVFYDNGGEAIVNGVSQHDSSNGFRPTVSISRAIGKFRLTLRLDSSASKPLDVSSNKTLDLKFSGPLF
jgi:hypothetical protein